MTQQSFNKIKALLEDVDTDENLQVFDLVWEFLTEDQRLEIGRKHADELGLELPDSDRSPYKAE